MLTWSGWYEQSPDRAGARNLEAENGCCKLEMADRPVDGVENKGNAVKRPAARGGRVPEEVQTGAVVEEDEGFSKWLGCPWPLSGVDSGYWYDKTLWSSGEAESDGLT